MSSGKIATRYAKAFFELALEQGLVEETRNDMLLVATVLQENKSLRSLLKSPVVKTSRKKSILRALFEAHCHSLSLSFMELLATNNRELFLDDIATAYEKGYRRHKGIVSVKLFTASPLDPALKDAMVAMISKDMDAEVWLEEAVDPDLIGGFVLRFEDRQYDASLSRELEKLKKNFDSNLYVRMF
jgi:F-type H+-transporting ATPase subunit delta